MFENVEIRYIVALGACCSLLALLTALRMWDWAPLHTQTNQNIPHTHTHACTCTHS